MNEPMMTIEYDFDGTARRSFAAPFRNRGGGAVNPAAPAKAATPSPGWLSQRSKPAPAS